MFAARSKPHSLSSSRDAQGFAGGNTFYPGCVLENAAFFTALFSPLVFTSPCCRIKKIYSVIVVLFFKGYCTREMTVSLVICCEIFSKLVKHIYKGEHVIQVVQSRMPPSLFFSDSEVYNQNRNYIMQECIYS